MTLQTMLDDAARTGRAHVEDGWAQGRATFGGLVGGMLLGAMRRESGQAADEMPLRSMTVSFVAPAEPGEVQVSPRVLRSGRSVVQCAAEMTQSGAVTASALASFGRSRDSAVSLAPEQRMAEMVDPEQVEPFPFLEGLTPDFFRHVELRPVDGGLPYSGAPTATLTGWMRLREPAGGAERPDLPFGEEHLVTLADAWPPAVIQMLETPAPASSLTWTLELLEPVRPLDPRCQWAYRVHTDAARDGYAHTEATLWSPDGTLVGISRQTVTVFG